jgi:P pilus assembly chaperone PapD
MSRFMLAAVIAALVVPTSGMAQINVGPLVRMMETSDGRGTIEITVRNDADEPVDITVVINDWAVDSAGNHSFRPAGTLPGSCGERLHADPRQLTLEPRGAMPIRISFEAAAEAAASRCRNIVFFRVTGAADEPGGDQLIISTGVKIYAGPREQLPSHPPSGQS